MSGDSAAGASGHGPVARLIALCARNPLLTLLFVGAAAAWGLVALSRTPLDAIPDLSDVQVIVYAEWPGRSPDLVEDQVTYPISATLLAAPGIRAVRGQSLFGVSLVYAIFDDGTDLYWARSRVLEYLDTARAQLPTGVSPTIGPDATGVGWVFEYALVDRSGGHDLSQLRSLQDWQLRYALASVPGVAEVASVGGFVREYQVNVDPNELASRGLTLERVVEAVRASNGDTGGGVIEVGGYEQVIRGRGYVRRAADLESVAVASRNGTPIRVRDLGWVTIGPQMRRGVAELDGKGETVGGIVVMRQGEDALAVIERVKARLAELAPSVPAGVEIVPTYDRSELIQASIRTLRRTLLEEMAVVSLVIFFFLLHARSALIPILTIPIGVLLAFVPMLHQGLTANIMSLGGIAVAIGAMVDAAIVLVENVHKHLEEREQAPGGDPRPRSAVLVEAMQEVGPSVFFALLVITVSFLPIFSLTGAAGRLFRPLAFTKTYAMGFAAVLSVTLTPALAAIFVRGSVRGETANPVNRWLVRVYEPAVRFVVRFRRAVVILAALAVLATLPALLSLESEFMPPLNEGTLLYMPSMPPGIPVDEAARLLQLMDREIASFPEVEHVFGKIGRAETSTDPAPLSMAETVIQLEPREHWRPGVTWDGLVQQLDERLRFPGVSNVWWMPIQTRTEMLSTGVRSALGVKLLGDDLSSLERAAIAIERTLAKLPGTRSAYAERATGASYLDFVVDREAAARYGLRVADVNQAIETAIGGMTVSQTVEGRERYPITVRYPWELRDDPSVLRRVLLATPEGAQIPIAQVASLEFHSGPDMIRSEAGRLVVTVFVDVAGRPVVDYVRDAQAAVAREVVLPPGTRLVWAGQFEHFERARRRLEAIVPLTLAVVALLLYWNTGSAAETGIVLLAVPFSLIGAIWLLWALGYHLSVAVWAGVIALAGLDAQTGVVMLLYLTLAHGARAAAGSLRSFQDLEEAIVEGAARRIRPKLMTVATAVIGLLPLLWSSGTGADLMKRVAAPMVGGLVTSFLLELLVYPAIFALWKGRGLTAPPRPSGPPASP